MSVFTLSFLAREDGTGQEWDRRICVWDNARRSELFQVPLHFNRVAEFVRIPKAGYASLLSPKHLRSPGVVSGLQRLYDFRLLRRVVFHLRLGVGEISETVSVE